MNTPSEQISEEREPSKVYGVMAEFETSEGLLRATEKAYAEGFRKMDAYSPIPVEGLPEALGYKKNYVALCVLIGGICGALGGFYLLYWISAIAYPHNVGGRPFNSWPSFIPITFECMILLSALTAVISMIVMNKLPQPYHPVFNVQRFERASKDRYFLCIEADDPKFSVSGVKSFLEQAGGVEVSVVPE